MSDPQDRAKQLVRETIEINLEKTDEKPDFGVYVVWFAYTLGNWKALLSSTLPDGRYYEVTHSQKRGETYVDTYVKVQNVCWPDLAP